MSPFEEEDEGDRGLTSCARYTCRSDAAPDLHFCSEANFLVDNCLTSSTRYRFIFPGNATVCAVSEPTVLTLAHTIRCPEQVGSIKFELFEDGARIRRYTEKEYPYTVFGDTLSPPTVNSRVLRVGSTYKLTVTMKNPDGCVNLQQSYQFDIVGCTTSASQLRS